MSTAPPPVTLQPIGVVRSPFKSLGDCPRQGPEEPAASVIEIDPAWVEGLDGLRPGCDLWVICRLRTEAEVLLKVHPRGDRGQPARGVLATRSPNRPCPLSLTLVRVEAIDKGRITVRGLEMIDGTPVLDIKPYVKGVDAPREGEGGP